MDDAPDRSVSDRNTLSWSPTGVMTLYWGPTHIPSSCPLELQAEDDKGANSVCDTDIFIISSLALPWEFNRSEGAFIIPSFQ